MERRALRLEARSGGLYLDIPHRLEARAERLELYPWVRWSRRRRTSIPSSPCKRSSLCPRRWRHALEVYLAKREGGVAHQPILRFACCSGEHVCCRTAERRREWRCLLQRDRIESQ